MCTWMSKYKHIPGIDTMLQVQQQIYVLMIKDIFWIAHQAYERYAFFEL